jgi:V8-like Glu-specific endopeptidase
MSRRARFVGLFVTAVTVACGILLFNPVNNGATADTEGRLNPTPSPAPSVSTTDHTFGGVATVGALFATGANGLGAHFCTASVVHSVHGDLAVTAAHCADAIQGQAVFVPGYASGTEPYGAWQVTAVYTDQAWQSSQDPDDDIAFLRLSDANGVPIESVTGAERLGIGVQTPTLVQVIGYPNDADQPVVCTNWAKALGATQLEFACDGYTDGTSGGPFLADTSMGDGQGTIIGVIGGYEHGGDTPEVSYASAFGPATAALFDRAEAGG